MRRILYKIFIFLLLLSSCIRSEDPWCILDGNVVYNDGLPAINVQVSLPGYGMVSTDNNGYFRFGKNVINGEYELTVFIMSTPVYKEKIILESGQTIKKLIKIPSPNLKDINVVDVHLESDWDYFVAGKQDYFFLKTNNNLPYAAFFHSFGQKKDYFISFNSMGLPHIVVSETYVFIFDNFSGKEVDFSIVSPNGDIQIIRSVGSSFNWDTDLFIKGSKVDAVKWFGRALGALPCITTGAAAFVTGGVAVPLALWTCGNYLLKISAGFFEDQGVHNGFTEMVNAYSLTLTNYNCTVGLTDPSSCLIDLSQKALEGWARNMDELESDENVRVAEASLYSGYGDIQITLTWNNKSDLDLHVIDPSGEEIFWKHKVSQSGGVLDYDNTVGFGPENVYWPKAKAPAGTYKVFVQNYYWAGRPSSSTYTLLINAFGKIKKFTGNIPLDKVVNITFFNHSGIFFSNKTYLYQTPSIKKEVI